MYILADWGGGPTFYEGKVEGAFQLQRAHTTQTPY